MDRQLRIWIIASAAIIAIGPFSIDMYLPSFPALQAHFGADAAAVQATLSAFFIGLAIGQLVYGPLADRYGRRKPLLFGMAVYALASAGCIFAPSIEGLVLLRFVQALGGSAGMVIVRAMVRDRFPPQQMAQVLSAMMAVMGIAPVLAPTIGGQVFHAFGWQGIFAALTLFGAFCMLLAARVLPETIAQRRAHGVAEVARSYLHLLGHRRFMGYALAGGTAQGAMFAYISVAAFVFIDAYQLSPLHFSWLFGMNAAGLIVASQLNALALRRLPAQRVMRRALVSSAGASCVLLLDAVTGFGGLAGIVVPLFFAIASLGFSFPNATAAAMAPFGDRAGIASALLGTLQFTIAAVTGAIAGALHDGTPVPMGAVMAACGITAVTLVHVLVPKVQADGT
ncbi:multidrug effflux MFS transporter [Solimonas flava]|uniref:multidrug effflux MFS transporter n=1 Tax=Solimonas flava TaxID=415849 RepID=UPI000429A836|nr:multidrug effflux MFS transporter [Solimonas flava]